MRSSAAPGKGERSSNPKQAKGLHCLSAKNGAPRRRFVAERVHAQLRCARKRGTKFKSQAGQRPALPLREKRRPKAPFCSGEGACAAPLRQEKGNEVQIPSRPKACTASPRKTAPQGAVL